MEQQRPETLALHFEHGGEIDAAVDYWHQAGSRALHRAAYPEALALLQRGLGLIADGLGSPERGRRTVQLLSTLGTVLISTKGYSSVEVEQTFARAWELCGDIGFEIPNDVVYGFWGVHMTRSSREGTAPLIPRLLQIAERTEDPVGVLTASACLGAVHYWQAEYQASHRYLTQGRRLFDTPEFQRFAHTFGYGVGLYSHAYGQLTLWMLGSPDQAAAVRQELLSIADRVRDPYCSAVALGFAMTLAHDRDDPAVELDFSDRLLTLAREQRLPVWVAIAQIGRGGAFARLGGGAEAIAPLKEGLLTLQHVGVMCSYGYFLTYLAEAYLDAGRFTEAAATLGEGCVLCGTLVARPHEPELLRLHGEMLLRRDGLAGENPALVESWYQRAMTLARATGAKAYELRISISLARLWHDLGRDREARALLDDVSAWFTEGKTTPDLRAAEALRAELG
jgi:tetratricopeptide (TPR) repeat protein